MPDALEIHAVGGMDIGHDLRDRRAAEIALLFQKQDLRAMSCRADGRRATRRSATANHYVELAQYGGKNATIRVWLAGDGEAAESVIQEIEASFQKHASGVRVELTEGQEED